MGNGGAENQRDKRQKTVRAADLVNARTALIGFGREGRALEQFISARQPGARVDVFAETAPAIPPNHWPLYVGPIDCRDQRVLSADRIMRSPGVPDRHPVLLAAAERGIAITTPSSLWFGERPDQPCIVVTGSKGKSTTTALIAHLLRAAGRSVVAAGNIGVPLLTHVDTQADWFVVELSSYQLSDLHARPDVGVITRLFPEHGDWHGSIEAYYAAKLRLVERLAGRPLWINGRDPVLATAVADAAGLRSVNRADDAGASELHVQDRALWRGDRRVMTINEWSLPGCHNLDNLALALSVVESIVGESHALIDAAKTFAGLPHRLERVDGPGRIVCTNDSISTTPHATRAALEACTGPVVLIAGGQDRGADWAPVIEATRHQPLAGLVVLPDNGVGIAGVLQAASAVAPENVAEAADMKSAVRAALRLAARNGHVLLSPGAPSFPHFRDFEDRGEQFRAALAGL